MPRCTHCGEPTLRKRRNVLQKVVSRAVYHCDKCGSDMAARRSFFTIFHRFCECPRCGTQDVSKLAARDRIDQMSPNPLRRILVLLGCPIYHCTFCRLQFRDWRNRVRTTAVTAK